MHQAIEEEEEDGYTMSEEAARRQIRRLLWLHDMNQKKLRTSKSDAKPANGGSLPPGVLVATKDDGRYWDSQFKPEDASIGPGVMGYQV